MKTEILDQHLAAPTVPEADPDANRFVRSRMGPFTGSVRVPVRKSNREYLRALRAAELAAWEQAGRKVVPQQTTPPPARNRLWVPIDIRGQRWETVLYGLLVAGSILAEAANLAAGLAFVRNWNLITEAVRAALT